MRKIFYILFSILLFCTNSMAFEWGGGLMVFCAEHALTAEDACIGPVAADGVGCGARYMNARDYGDEFAVQLLVAMGHNDRGAKFCPVQVEGKNKNKGNAWTEYTAVGENNCLWLCLPGYTGPECATPVTTTDGVTCDATNLDASLFADLPRVANGPNIEDQVTMFNRALGNSCGVHKSQEHDEILAIRRWLPSKHGALAHRMIVRAQREGWKDMISWAAVYPALQSSDVLVCMDGFQPNATKDDCVPIDPVLCCASASDPEECMLSATCPGWDKESFDSGQLKLYYMNSSNCYQFRCSKKGYAFRSAKDRTCELCGTTSRFGASPKDGTCIECEIGKIFDENAAATGYCANTKSFTKTDLQYGPGQTRNTNFEVDNQCWTKRGPEYFECMGVSTGTETTSDNTESSGE